MTEDMKQRELFEARVEAVRRGVRSLKVPVRGWARRLVWLIERGSRADQALDSLYGLLGSNPPNYLNPWRPELDARKRKLALGQACYGLSVIQQTPPWADPGVVRGFYVAARELSRTTGRKHVVDHVVPLSSPRVCGLHCSANLRIVEDSTNGVKSNHWWPDMPNRQLALFEDN